MLTALLKAPREFEIVERPVPEPEAGEVLAVASSHIDVPGFISGTYPLRDTAGAFKEYEGNPGRILRLVIDSRAA